jgi:two-component sensor histidine kinase
LIINELVSNALKHGFPDIVARCRGVGEIHVDLHRNPDKGNDFLGWYVALDDNFCPGSQLNRGYQCLADYFRSQKTRKIICERHLYPLVGC